MIQMTIASQPDARAEAARLDTFAWCDETPLGRYIVAGAPIRIWVEGLAPQNRLSVTAGFAPTWSSEPGWQEIPLSEGGQSVTFQVDGPLFVRHCGTGPAVRIRVDGGKPLALWHKTAGWISRDDTGQAPWVQYVSDRVLITLPRRADGIDAIPDPAATFTAIEGLLDLHDELSGRTETQGRHQPCRNRIHFLTDIWASQEDRELFYMYACEGYIAMLPDNVDDLIDPRRLQQEWAIWHELGHMYQPHSWTWEAHIEVNVNLWSLFAQERFGQPSRLEAEPEHHETAERMLAEGQMDLRREGDPFVQLVMLERLRDEFGWGLFVELNRRYRDAPLPDDAEDSRKIDLFCGHVQDICGKDLSAFFRNWGLCPP